MPRVAIRHNNEHHEAKIYLVSIRREVRNIVHQFRIPNNTFRSSFRLTKPLFRKLMRQVLSVLSFYATGSYQALMGASFRHCLGRSTMGRYINEVTDALNHPDLQRRWIKFPRKRAGRELVKARNEREFGIPGVIGFIDGTEVSITKPPDDLNPKGFWTRKHHYALNCQVVSDCNMVILNVNASHPGATGDAFIWAHSALRRRMKEAYEEDQSSWLLGDSAYPTEPWMLIPILGAPEGSPEAYFTERHCHARCTVERTFGILKGRWRCLLRDRKLHYHPAKCAKIMKACCLLHNLCRLNNLDDNDEEIPLGEEEPLYFVPQENEVNALEAAVEEGLEEHLQVDQNAPHNRVNQVGVVIRQRMVGYLDIQRHEEL